MVLVIATAGLVYELCMAAVASYLLGDSIRQFSLIIGVYLSALGLGAYLSKHITARLAEAFVHVELSAALMGGLSAPFLFVAFALTDAFPLVLYGVVVLVGTLVGLELPLLIRLLERNFSLKDLVAKALTFDYAGALLGSLGFSLWLVPHLGLAQASVVCGLLNALVGLASTWVLPALSDTAHSLVGPRRSAIAVVMLLLAFLPFTERCLQWSESYQYPGVVMYRHTSDYQRIVLVQQPNDQFSLFLSGHLQFSSSDEKAYHVALTAPALSATATPRRVLVGGGGDGLAVRELLRWPGVEHITLVDLDPAMTELARSHPALLALNQHSFDDPRVRVINADAMTWLGQSRDEFDVVILDFPDPSNYAIGKLFSEQFYRRVLPRLSETGTIAVQASSPLLARATYWCTVRTLQSVGMHTVPYHQLVPSFGEWGFVLAKKHPFAAPPPPNWPLVETDNWHQWFVFPPDMARIETQSNRLNTQKLVSYYLQEWGRLQ